MDSDDSEGYPQQIINEFFDNNGGNFVGQSGASGEVVRTYTLDQPVDWYFWTDAIDAPGQFVNSGAWGDAFRLSVISVIPQPSLTVQYLNSNDQVLTPQADGRIHVMIGTSIKLRYIASSPAGTLARLYWRTQKPDNMQGSPMNGQWAWGGWGWGGEMPVSGNTTWTSDPIVMDTEGLWNFWHHAKAGVAGPITGDGNENGWATVADPDIMVDTQPPNIPPVGYVDTLGQSGSVLNPSGWAIDQEDGALIKYVSIFMNGNLLDRVSNTTNRFDVGAHAVNALNYPGPESRYYLSGWTLLYDLRTLAVGSHSVRFTATDQNNVSAPIGEFSFTVSQSQLDLDSDNDGVPDVIERAVGTNPLNGGDIPADAVESYDHDKLNRLISAPGGGYDYDKEGNLNPGD
ncbi:MAG: hypothetical protein QM760_14805 [Nibricoccus sp.]